MSSLEVGAEEDLGWRNASADVLAGLEQEDDGEGDDGDGVRSRKSAKSDLEDREKKTKKKGEVRDKDARGLSMLRRAGSWSGWRNRRPRNRRTSAAIAPAPEPTVTADPGLGPTQGPLAAVKSKPNPRSSSSLHSTVHLSASRCLNLCQLLSRTSPPAARRNTNRYRPPSSGDEVEATKAGASAPKQATKATKATGNPAQPKAAAPKSDKNVVST
ncbi:hypothetical protein EDB87DRAFT_1575348 [Lactarius vividus]|nr:hypothetical protein EDB87DRAFT_1575348 [Lactarius vividus]